MSEGGFRVDCWGRNEGLVEIDEEFEVKRAFLLLLLIATARKRLHRQRK